jgi:hypothetical protein
MMLLGIIDLDFDVTEQQQSSVEIWGSTSILSFSLCAFDDSISDVLRLVGLIS